MNGWLEHDDYRVKPMGWFLNTVLPKWVSGITLAPFGIYIDEWHFWYDKDLPLIVAHERIHWRQQMEMLIIFFYLWYGIEWLVKLFEYGGQAYRNISFERAAYAGDGGRYAWIKYL